MKAINKKLVGVILGSLLLLFPSCTDYLEQPEGSTLTQEMVFSTPDMAMNSLFTVYGSCVINGFITGEGGSNLSDAGTRDGLMMALCDEGDQYGNNTARTFKNGTWGNTTQNEFDLWKAMAGVRNAAVFLDNLDKVPLIETPKYKFDAAYREQVRGEAKVLRAMVYFEMLRRYGGMPLITQTPKVVIVEEGGVKRATIVPSAYRQSFQSTVNFIVSSCDEALAYLPNSYSSAERGRVTKGVALAIKARTLLYAASPLYNSDTSPVSYGNAQDSLIRYPSYDANRWQIAADAAKAAIDWAEANGYALLQDLDLNGRLGEGYQKATGDVLNPKNKEIIYFDHSHAQQPGGANIIRWGCPIYYSWGQCVMAMPINFLKTFRDLQGNDMALPTEGNYTTLKNILRKAEPRFHESIWAPGFPYTSTGNMNSVGGADTAKFLYRKLVSGSQQTVQTGSGTQLLGIGIPNGFHLKKFINQVNATTGVCNLYWPTYRLAELYLNYAEALNEITPGNAEIVNSINKIRYRGGLPAISQGALSQAQMRELIRKERGVELYAEEHRPFDVRRWKIASQDGVMTGKFYRIYLYENGTGTYKAPGETGFPSGGPGSVGRVTNDNYLSYKIEEYETRIWSDKMYYYPFPLDEVNKGFLMQNPGW